MRFIAVCGGFLSVLSLILLAVGMATDHWVDFSFGKGTPLNPTEVNDELARKERSGTARSGNTLISDRTTRIEYNVKHYGLWIGCYVERSNSTAACAYVESSCKTNVCWIRQSQKNREETCRRNRMRPLVNCTAYQFVRAFVCMGIIFMVFGTSAQLVSLLTLNRTLAAVAGVLVFVSGILTLFGFSIFYGEEYARKGIDEAAEIGFSLILVTIAWPVMLIAGIMSCCSASLGIRKQTKFDYSQSNF